MNQRLLEAYDHIRMPEDCARRIETALERGGRPSGNQYVRRVSPAPRGRSWAAAVGAVCLVLALSVGGTFLYLRASENPGNLPETAATHPPVPGTTPEQTEAGNFVLSKAGEAFLGKLCYYMPDWSGYESLDETYWRDFLFFSFTCPELLDNGRARTVYGEMDCVPVNGETMVRVSREDMEGYVRLAMGCGLPEFTPAPPEDGGEAIFYYENGYYFIGVSDFGDIGYRFRDWESCSEADGTYGTAGFDIYAGEPENVLGRVEFTLSPADNENGFIIVRKATTSAEDSDRLSVGIAAWLFTDVYLAGDTEAMQQYLADSFTGPVEGYPGGPEEVVMETAGLPEAGAELQVGDVVTVQKTLLGPAAQNSYNCLTLELVKQADGWKVRSYALDK